MAKDSQRLEQEFIVSARDKTGHDLPEWIAILQAKGESKTNTLINWLKTDHKLNHMQATFLTGIYLNDGQPVYDYAAMFAKLFEGQDALMPAYRALEMRVCEQIEDVEFVPTRAYVSIEGKRCFACATFTRTNIRVGLDLGDLQLDETIQKAKSLGAMPNLTHMVEISTAADVDDRLLDLVGQAYKRAHRL